MFGDDKRIVRALWLCVYDPSLTRRHQGRRAREQRRGYPEEESQASDSRVACPCKAEPFELCQQSLLVPGSFTRCLIPVSPSCHVYLWFRYKNPHSGSCSAVWRSRQCARRPGRPEADCVARPPLCSCHDKLHPACLAPRLASLVRTLRCLGLTGNSAPGKVRLAKWFSTMPPKQKAKIVKDVTQLVLARRTRMCNVLEYKGAFITSSWAPETSTHCEDRYQGRIPSICVPLLRHRHYRVRQRARDTGNHPPLRGGS
jgi:hypothetical protein